MRVANPGRQPWVLCVRGTVSSTTTRLTTGFAHRAGSDVAVQLGECRRSGRLILRQDHLRTSRLGIPPRVPPPVPAVAEPISDRTGEGHVPDPRSARGDRSNDLVSSPSKRRKRATVRVAVAARRRSTRSGEPGGASPIRVLSNPEVQRQFASPHRLVDRRRTDGDRLVKRHEGPLGANGTRLGSAVILSRSCWSTAS